MDWKDIKPLTETEALSVVSNYFYNHKFIPKRIDTNNIPEGQHSPDLTCAQNDKDIFFCEVKTPSHIFNEELGLYTWNTAFNKLRSHMHTAVKQFKDADIRHSLPRVVAFTSNHPQLNWTHLQHNILGAVKYGDKILKDFRGKTFVADTNKDINAIDIFLWFQVNYINRNSIVELAIYQNCDSQVGKMVDELVPKLTPYKNENIQTPRYSALSRQ
ncbi:MAG TPA: hypothetical protein VG935_00630 [Patescibacteria group bacterium]|nr:hypothetical protein [Patescibacteria group bacterium]